MIPTLLNKLSNLEELRECYYIRLYNINNGYALINTFDEKNEIDIKKIKTKIELSKIEIMIQENIYLLQNQLDMELNS